MRRLGWFLNEHGMWQARPWLVWVLQRVFGLDVIPAVDRRYAMTPAEREEFERGRKLWLEEQAEYEYVNGCGKTYPDEARGELPALYGEAFQRTARDDFTNLFAKQEAAAE
jgi:hypothetical protein